MSPSLLPADVAARLATGMAAFVKGARPGKLPPEWRRRQGFTPAALRRSPGLLDMLEDEGMRAVILEWLDEDHPKLPAEVATSLAAACRRDPGWDAPAAEVREAPASPQPTPPKARSDAAERDRLREARAEIKDLRERVKRAEASDRSATAALHGRIDELTDEVATERRRAERAEAELRRAQAAAERDLRKARRGAEAAEERVARARKQVAELRRDLDAAKAAARTGNEKKTARKKPQAGPPPGPRRPLPVPQGRLADDPETLRAWLAAQGVVLVVDGYNVTLSGHGFAGAELDAQRRILVQAVGALTRPLGAKALVVFDGSALPAGLARIARGPVTVEYSRPDEIADDHLIARLADFGGAPVVVVTDDRELRGRAEATGATIATTAQLLSLLRPAR